MTKKGRVISYIVTIRGAIPPDLTRKLAEAHAEAIGRSPRPQADECEQILTLTQLLKHVGPGVSWHTGTW